MYQKLSWIQCSQIPAATMILPQFYWCGGRWDSWGLAVENFKKRQVEKLMQEFEKEVEEAEEVAYVEEVV